MNTKRFGLFARSILNFASILILIFSQVGLAIASPALASFTPSDGQAATLVLGQPDFISNTFSITQTGMHGPTGIVVDPTSGKIFVADCDNNRVLRFASVNALTNGAVAEVVLGQPDFTTNIASTTQNGMHCPDQISFDSNGRLWVTDFYNSRVLRFDIAVSKASGADADGVLGQPDFTTSVPATTQDGMRYPEGVFVDADGRVWVGDTLNNRILRFDNAAAKANGADADGVLGQPDFTTSAPATTQSGMYYPVGVFVDTDGRVWVTDKENHRVLRFDNAAAKTNGANADGVLGQLDLTSGTQAMTQSGMAGPVGVAMNATGHLYISDGYHSRILVFENAATLANGANASNILGQTDFTTGTHNTGGISAATLYYPYQLSYDPAAEVLWVTDYGNHRVLMYGTPDITPPSTRYVATTGVDTGDCGNSVTPCATITYAISQAVAGNTIQIAAGTYTEAGIIVDKDLTFTGAGATGTIVQADVTPGTATDRVFFINSGVTAIIENMTIQNGRAIIPHSGGGIYNQGALTLNNSIVRDNSAADGGGILNHLSTMTLNNSTVSNNSAANGGGIFNLSAMTLNNSTVSGNLARLAGGGIFNVIDVLTLNYSTVANNSSDSDNDTDGDGGGIYTHSEVILNSSIVAGNKKGASVMNDTTADCAGTSPITSQGYNLTGTGTGCNLSGTGDVTVDSADVFTNILDVLASNSGATQTHALILSNSNPALNAVPNGTNECGIAPFDLDQRGEARPFGSGCDMGAYEAQSAPPANNPVPSLSEISSASARAGDPDEPLTVIGTDFATDAVVRWHDGATSTTTDLSTTYISASELSALVPAALLTAPGTFEVSVFNPAPGGGSSSSLPFFVTQSAATVVSSDTATSTSPTGTAVASTGGSGAGTPGSVTASATGTGTVTVAIYDSNPRSDSPFKVSTGGFFDVYVAQGSNFSSLTIVACNMPGTAKIRWLDDSIQPTQWRLVDPQSYSSGCVTMDLSASSFPTIAQLTGTIFGVEGYEFSGFLSPVDNPDIVNIGKAGRTYPIKWHLKDGDGLFVSDLGAITSISYRSNSCNAFSGDPADALESETTGGTSLRYDAASNQYVYNWKTPGVGCYTLFLRLNTGQVFHAYFNLK